MFKSKLGPIKFIELLPAIGSLVGTVVDALKDRKLTAEEISTIGAKLVAIVASAIDTE